MTEKKGKGAGAATMDYNYTTEDLNEVNELLDGNKQFESKDPMINWGHLGPLAELLEDLFHPPAGSKDE